ncbi:Hypothetical predicted protein [Lecanosticta acicola]|uniref:Aminoglycoside phosphotransferase domain-containing protein n=1 Tax=Lecanosticta acicola TaxID=111012 RepID=A0AAI9E8C6_9PEZI|nr:Hypothetical predicted protein [Lecanosticta acicola]
MQLGDISSSSQGDGDPRNYREAIIWITHEARAHDCHRLLSLVTVMNASHIQENKPDDQENTSVIQENKSDLEESKPGIEAGDSTTDRNTITKENLTIDGKAAEPLPKVYASKEWQTLDEILEKESDYRYELSASKQNVTLRMDLESRRQQLEDLISRQLNIPPSQFVSSDQQTWLWGSFNFVINIEILKTRGGRLPRKALLRIALPHAIEDGEMLSKTFEEHRNDPIKRNHLYTSIANIMLDLGKIPQPQIGSFTISNEGIISLTNRPLANPSAFWMRHNWPLPMSRNLTYSSTETYAQDLLALQDLRIQHQVNSIQSRDDGLVQLSILVGFRALLPQLFNPRLSRGNFVMSVTDMHQSNILVDENWKITRLIDLEFACSRPIEFVEVPHWFAAGDLDSKAEHLQELETEYHKFVDVVAHREKATKQNDAFSRALLQSWTSGRYWFIQAMESIDCFYFVYRDHFRKKFFKDYDHESHAWPIAQLWTEDVNKFINLKVDGLEQYQKDVREMFSEVEAWQRHVGASSQRSDSIEESHANKDTARETCQLSQSLGPTSSALPSSDKG